MHKDDTQILEALIFCAYFQCSVLVLPLPREAHHPPVPCMRYGHSNIIDDQVFLWGGKNGTEGACRVLYTFDINTNSPQP